MNRYLFIFKYEMCGESLDSVSTFEGEDLTDQNLRDDVCHWLEWHEGMGDMLSDPGWKDDFSEENLTVYRISDRDPIYPFDLIEETREKILAVIKKNKEEDEIVNKEKRKKEFEKLKKEFGD